MPAEGRAVFQSCASFFAYAFLAAEAHSFSMRSGEEGTKLCHLIWMTRDGRLWFKIAAAARFCERAVRHACTAQGWKPETIVVLPDRVHILVLVPLAEDRWSVSPRLQQATTHLLAESGVLAEGTGPVWTGDGWCSVLPSAVSAAAVRRVLREKVAAYVGNNSDA
jgi:REP element-mobilizing transposase RayT